MDRHAAQHLSGPSVPVDWWAQEERDIVVVAGDDASTFLDGQMSQAISSIDSTVGAWSLLLEPDGKLGHLVAITESHANGFVVLPGPGRAEEVAQRLRRFVLRSSVTLEVERARVTETTIGIDEATAGGLPSAVSTGSLRILGDPVLPPDAEVDPATVRAWRLATGHPGEEEGLAGLVPLALGDTVVDAAASFTKGCYTGQELVARTTSRGAQPPVSLLRLRSAHELRGGDQLTVGGDEVGHVVSAAALEGQWVGFGAVARRVVADATMEIDCTSGGVERA